MKLSSVLTVAALAAASAAHAEMITVGFTGTITELDETQGMVLSGDFSLGDPVTGTFTYDDTVESSGFSNQGEFRGAIVDVQASVGSRSVAWAPTLYGEPAEHILETNNNNLNGPYLGDHIRLRDVGATGDQVDGVDVQQLLVNMSDGENIVFPDNPSTQSLTPTYDFAEFEWGQLLVIYSEPSTGGGLIACAGCVDPRRGSVRVSIDEFFIVAPPACSGDVDGDGETNIFDFNAVLANFGAGPDAAREDGDLTGDGLVNVFDFNAVLADFGCVPD